MVEKLTSDLSVEEIWVNVTEAAEKTGYHRDYVQKLANKNWKLPEDQREIQVRRHSNGYMLWLPTLVEYFGKSGTGRGPRPRRESDA
jgi:hypothetical protein